MLKIFLLCLRVLGRMALATGVFMVTVGVTLVAFDLLAAKRYVWAALVTLACVAVIVVSKILVSINNKAIREHHREVSQTQGTVGVHDDGDEDDTPVTDLLDLVSNQDATAATQAVAYSLDQLFARLGPPPEETGRQQLLIPTRGGGGHR